MVVHMVKPEERRLGKLGTIPNSATFLERDLMKPPNKMPRTDVLRSARKLIKEPGVSKELCAPEGDGSTPLLIKTNERDQHGLGFSYDPLVTPSGWR